MAKTAVKPEVKKEDTSKEVTPKPETTATPTPAEAPTPKIEGEAVKPEPTPEKVTEDGITKIQVGGGEEVLDGGKDDFQTDPTEGIDKKAKESKDVLDTQKKAEEAIKDGTSGLDAIGTSEVQSNLVKDYNTDRPVYPTASAWLAATTAAGKLGGE